MNSQIIQPAQVAAALTQVSALVGHFRQGISTAAFPKNAPKTIQEPVTTVRPGKNVKKGRPRNQQKSLGKRKARPDLDVNACIELLSKEENLSTLLPLMAVTENSSIQQRPWFKNHVSSNSFFENRNGFPESSLDGIQKKSIQLLGLDNKPLLTLHVPVFSEQRRYYLNMQGFGHRKMQPKQQQQQQQPTSFNQTDDAAESLGKSILQKVTKGQQGNVNITISDDKRLAFLKTILITFIVVMICTRIMRNLTQTEEGSPALNLFDSNEFQVENVTVSFADVCGVDEAKEELQDAVEFLKYPKKFQDIGAKLPKGILLVGKPGIGKTLLAKAVAGEAGVPFFYASGAQFDDLYVGSGARRVRKLFSKARMNAPCVIFIDEIDSAGAKRTNTTIHPYANQTINQLLSDMDGFNASTGIIVIAATNKRENLDDALIRPGRFDVEVNVQPPDTKGREAIFNLYLNKVRCDPGLNVRKLAEATPGMTGADISNIVNQAALRAAIVGKKVVSWEHLDFALDKQRMGPAWKNKVLKKVELEKTAYHEAGHTLMILYSKEGPELNKVTILPRGKALGFTSFLPESDSYSESKSQMLASIDIALGGRVAEEIFVGVDHVSSGAYNDFQKATAIATNMVKLYGMSDKVGVRIHSDKPASAQYQQLVDIEIQRILKESYDRVKATLTTHNKELDRLGKALLKYGTLERDEVLKVIKGERIEKEIDDFLKDKNFLST